MENKEEIWKEIIGYDHRYFISNLGRIKSLARTIPIISYGSYDTGGYLRTALVKNGKPIGKKIHRLVAEYFIGNYSDELTINHMDFNKSNNTVSNLEVITVVENVMHFIINKRKPKTSSRHIGVTYHLQIKKWTSRVNINGERFSVGTYNTEWEAVQAREKFLSGINTNLKIGKGSSNKGKCKYTQEQKDYALDLAKKVGVRKAGAKLGMGSTQISKWRRELKSKTI